MGATRQSHVGAMCPVCKEPLSTHIVFGKKIGPRTVFNRLMRPCFTVVVH